MQILVDRLRNSDLKYLPIVIETSSYFGSGMSFGIYLDETNIVEVSPALDDRDAIDELFQNDMVVTTKYKVYIWHFIWEFFIAVIAHMG